MLHFNLAWQALLPLIWVFFSIGRTDSATIQAGLPDIPVILNFLRKHILPHFKVTQYNRNVLRPEKIFGIENFIRKTVSDLKPFLQDDDVKENEDDEVNESEDKLTLNGNEVTVLEIVPGKRSQKGMKDKAESLKSDIKHYKKLRKKIKKALEQEHISESTKELVTKTLDSMIAHMLENQCLLKSNPIEFRHNKDNRGEHLEIANIWINQWNDLNTQYKKVKTKHDGETQKFFDQFQEFVSKIGSDIQAVSNKYKVVCSVVDTHLTIRNNTYAVKDFGYNQKGKAYFRTGQSHSTNGATCPIFKVCSSELTTFMVEFYDRLNDTAVNVLRNYAEMFKRDAFENISRERDNIALLVNKISSIVEVKVNKTFAERISKFKLDQHKDKLANVKAINEFISKTITLVKKRVSKVMASGLDELKESLQNTICQEIDVNLDIELRNVGTDFAGRICNYFELCNGQPNSRRSTDAWVPNFDKDNIYVKVELSLDEDSKVTPVNRLNISTQYDINFRSDITNKTVAKVSTTIKYDSDEPAVRKLDLWELIGNAL